MRLGRREFDASEPVVLVTAFPAGESRAGSGATPDPAAGGDAAPTAQAVERALAAGADVLELVGYDAGPAAELVAAVRSRHRHVAVGVRARDPEVAEAAVDAGADMLAPVPGDVARWLAGTAAAGGTGLVVDSVRSAERALAAGVPRDGVLVATAYPPRAAPWRLPDLPGLVASGWPVLVTLPDGEPSPETLTAAATYAWIGAWAFRTGRITQATRIAQARGTVDMVAVLRGSRGPAVARRGLV